MEEAGDMGCPPDSSDEVGRRGQQIYGRDVSDEGSAHEQPSKVSWLGPADTPWGVPVLDVRPFTCSTVSTSRNPQCAENALSFLQDDGTSFIGVKPPVSRTIG